MPKHSSPDLIVDALDKLFQAIAEKNAAKPEEPPAITEIPLATPYDVGGVKTSLNGPIVLDSSNRMDLAIDSDTLTMTTVDNQRKLGLSGKIKDAEGNVKAIATTDQTDAIAADIAADIQALTETVNGKATPADIAAATADVLSQVESTYATKAMTTEMQTAINNVKTAVDELVANPASGGTQWYFGESKITEAGQLEPADPQAADPPDGAVYMNTTDAWIYQWQKSGEKWDAITRGGIILGPGPDIPLLSEVPLDQLDQLAPYILDQPDKYRSLIGSEIEVLITMKVWNNASYLSGITPKYRLIGINHDIAANGDPVAMTFEQVEVFAPSYPSSGNTNPFTSGTANKLALGADGGWGSSSMRAFLNNEWFNEYPESIKASIKPTKRTYLYVDSDGVLSVSETVDSITLFSKTEISPNTEAVGDVYEQNLNALSSKLYTGIYELYSSLSPATRIKPYYLNWVMGNHVYGRDVVTQTNSGNRWLTYNNQDGLLDNKGSNTYTSPYPIAPIFCI